MKTNLRSIIGLFLAMFALAFSASAQTNTPPSPASVVGTNKPAITREDMSQQGYSPFRLTLEELNLGIKSYDSGVYYFPLTGDEYRRALAMFLKNHLLLEVSSSTGEVVRMRGGKVVQAERLVLDDSQDTDYGATIGYTVTFRQRGS